MLTKITIGVPCNRVIRPKTMQCLLELVAKGGYDFHTVISEEGYTIAENRTYLAVQAINNKSEYLLFIDDDMTFEPDLLDKLIANGKDVCGVAYRPRADVGQITYFLDETHIKRIEESNDPKYKTLFECHATGTGVMLIKCEIFKKIPRPWFEFKYGPMGNCRQGEDWFFCEKARNNNFTIWADPRPKVNHLGEIVY